MNDALNLVGRFLGHALNRTVEEVVAHRLAPVREERDVFRRALLVALRALPPLSGVLLTTNTPSNACVEYEPSDLVAEIEAGRPREVMAVRCGPPREYPPSEGGPSVRYPSIPNPADPLDPPAVDYQAERAKASLAALLSSLPPGSRVEVRSEALAKLGQSTVEASWLASEARDGKFYDLVAVRLPQPKAPKPGEVRRSTSEVVAAVDGAVAGLLSSLAPVRAASEGRAGVEVAVGRRKAAVKRRKSA